MVVGLLRIIAMQPLEKKTEAIETAPSATDPAESETLSERAEGILEAVEANTRSGGLEQRARCTEGTYKTIADRLDLRERTLEQAEQRLRRLQAEADEAIGTLETRWKQGRSITDDLENELDTIAAQAVNTIERHQDAVRELETRFGSVQDRLTGIEHACDRLTEAIEDNDQRIGSLRAETAGIHDMLDAETQRSVALVEDVRRGLDGLDTQAAALTEHLEKAIASASSDVDRLTQQASHAFGQLTEAIGACESAQRTTASTSTDIGGTCQHAEKPRQALQERLTSAGNRMEHLTTLIERIEHANGQQQKQNDEARCLTEQLEGAIQDGRVAANEQNQLVGETVAECDRTHQALRVTLESGRRISDQLVSLNQAGRQITEMVTGNISDAHAASDHLVATLQSVTEASAEAARAIEVFTELFVHVESKQQLFEDGQRLVKQFVDQASGIQQTLDKLQGRSQRLQIELGTALAAPKRLLADADARAQQLSDVCRAVRKVFAGLSKVSLEAHERVTTFNELRAAVDERIEQLQTHTTTASETLRQWVTEAARAQERLAATLERAPSIHATHPAGSLAAPAGGHGITSSAIGVSTVTTAPATDPIESKATSQPEVSTTINPTTDAVEVDTGDAATQPVNADGKSGAIARMIDEARRRCGIST